MNLIQQALYEYIIDKDYNDKMLQYNALLDYLFEDLLYEETATAKQEILTCIFLDAYCNSNKNKPFDNIEELINWYNSEGQKIIENQNNKNELNEFFKSGKNFNKNTPYTIWQVSWYYQCVSMQKWLEAKKWSVGSLYFIHHDTGFTINNGDITYIEKNSSIIGRVINGLNQFKKTGELKTLLGIDSISKDNYTKADIYVTSKSPSISEKSDKTLDKEIEDWKNGITNKKFAGISLKQLLRIIPNVPHTIGMEKNIYTLSNEPIIIKCDLFNGVDFKKMTIGKVSVFLEFGINDCENNELNHYKITIRSNGEGADNKVKNNKIDEYLTRSIRTSFATSASLLPDTKKDKNNINTNANLGKLTSILNTLGDKEQIIDIDNIKISELLEDINNNLDKLSDDYEKNNKFEINKNAIKLIKFIEENLNNLFILFDTIHEYCDTNKLLNSTITNYNELYNYSNDNYSISNLLSTIATSGKAGNSPLKTLGKNPSSQNIKDQLYNLYFTFRWYNVVKSVLMHLKNISIELVKETNDSTNNSKGSTIVKLFTSAKESALPYILIG